MGNAGDVAERGWVRFRCEISIFRFPNFRTGKFLLVTFWVFEILIHQRACWIEDIKVHGENFCIVWYISIFLLTVAVYYACTAGFEV